VWLIFSGFGFVEKIDFFFCGCLVLMKKWFLFTGCLVLMKRIDFFSGYLVFDEKIEFYSWYLVLMKKNWILEVELYHSIIYWLLIFLGFHQLSRGSWNIRKLSFLCVWSEKWLWNCVWGVLFYICESSLGKKDIFVGVVSNEYQSI